MLGAIFRALRLQLSLFLISVVFHYIKADPCHEVFPKGQIQTVNRHLHEFLIELKSQLPLSFNFCGVYSRYKRFNSLLSHIKNEVVGNPTPATVIFFVVNAVEQGCVRAVECSVHNFCVWLEHMWPYVR